MCIYKGWVKGGSTTGAIRLQQGEGQEAETEWVRGAGFSKCSVMWWWCGGCGCSYHLLLNAISDRGRGCVECFFSVLHHVVLQRVYLRRVLLTQHFIVLVLRGERVLDVQRLVLFGWGGLHGVLQLILGIRIILRNDSPMLDLWNNPMSIIMSPTLKKNY